MNQTDPRLHKLLGGDALAALRLRLRRRFERGAPDTSPIALQLGALTPSEREALAVLMGRPPRDAISMRIDVGALDATLRNAGLADSLRDALERLDGPIVHPASLRAATTQRWAEVVASCTYPELADSLQAAAALGLLKRLARQDSVAATRLLDQASSVLRRLPVGGMARAQLAAETLGNAHALDNGQPVATLVLSAWRYIERRATGLSEPLTEAAPDDTRDSNEIDAPEERLRDVWARAGVLVNELARPALCLNLPVENGGSPLCTPGEPAYVSLRRLLRNPPRWAVDQSTVFVCENPNLIAIAADRLGANCASIVCTDGMPAAAQRTLLTQLAQGGAMLTYHGDFDWPGLQIGNHVMRTWNAKPWRFSAHDYEAIAVHAPHARRDLSDVCIEASWDPALRPAMVRHGLAIAEEAMAASLFKDLAKT
jgi:uncharacterized protein (TIGR02679 family)